MADESSDRERVERDIERLTERCDSLIDRYESSESIEERTRLADGYAKALQQLETSELLLEQLSQARSSR